jgi:AcrR family transcriptional regulator
MYGVIYGHLKLESIHYVWFSMARLNRARWVEEGLAVLREDGARGLAADPMARRLGVSRGSFYWHFSSALDFEAAVLGEWEEQWTTRVMLAVEAGGDDPEGSLRSLIERTGGQDASVYASAKRMARKHPDLNALMHRIDERRLALSGRYWLQVAFPKQTHY